MISITKRDELEERNQRHIEIERKERKKERKSKDDHERLPKIPPPRAEAKYKGIYTSIHIYPFSDLISAKKRKKDEEEEEEEEEEEDDSEL
jgi:hypothetical protein